ncbi:MAG TPA: metallophosphoesterase [Terracidiphilus sp.]|nr:metallophosphoesterase [Terracidiphilus sp.]
MILSPPLSYRSILLLTLACFVSGVFYVPCTRAQTARPSAPAHPAHPRQAESSGVPALLISDIHFDPFHDPAKVKQLAAAPVADWRTILSTAPSPDQQQGFDALQQKCNSRGVDTPFALLRSSLQAMRRQQPDAKFMVVSGDLIAHAFTCRYAAAFPGAPSGDYEAFVEKTLSFVMGELRAEFPGMPVYAALGNNDTGCGDYQLDGGSDFLAKSGKIIAEGLPPSEQQQAIKDFAAGGYYSVTMAEPMKDTRLIVVNDLFLSPKYRTCTGHKGDSAAIAAQMSWLKQELQQAQLSRQRVWVVGHIPPGIDSYSTLSKFRDVCGGQDPVMFLSSDKLADLMVDYADIVKLAIFAHTHMDEVRLLESDGADAKSALDHSVAVKMIPSISPVDGNNPSFTVAHVNPSSATIDDYVVISASNQTGIATNWTKEYDYAQTYHQSQFSPSAVADLIAKFHADHGANTAPSEAYLRSYFVGDRSMLLSPFWPQYVCALDSYTAKGYAACVCSTGK